MTLRRNTSKPRVRQPRPEPHVWLSNALAALARGVVPMIGAAARSAGTQIQASATAVRPSPSRANADRSLAYADGCHLPDRATRSPNCAYGDAESATTVVLFGDSHAMQYFPALQRVATQ